MSYGYQPREEGIYQLLKSDGKLPLQCVQLINAAVVKDQEQSHLLFLQLINKTVYPDKQ